MISRRTIICTIIYRFIIQFICQPLLEFVSYLKIKFSPPKPDQTVQLLYLFYHQTPSKNQWYDLSQPKFMFIWLHHKFDNFDLLKSPKWSLFGFDSSYAYFVKLPKPFHEYNARNSTFIHLTQVDEAIGLARMKHEDFYQFGEEIGSPKGKVVLISSAPRAGSTLLTQMFQLSNVCFAFSEPDCFTHLSILYDEKTVPEEIYDQLLIGTFNILCKDQTKTQTFVFKPQGPVSGILTDVIRLMPLVKHVFLFRATKCIHSNVRIIISTMGIDTYFKIKKWTPKLADWFMPYARIIGKATNLTQARSSLDFCYVYYILSYSAYLKAKDDILYTTYEAIVSRPEEEMSKLLKELGIPLEYLNEAIEPLQRDSQKDSIYSQDKMKGVGIEDFDLHSDRQKERFKQIDEQLGITEQVWQSI